MVVDLKTNNKIMIDENNEAKTSNYEDVKKMQDAIVKHGKGFEKLGLSKLVGSKLKLHEERERLEKELAENGISQCSACNQELTKLNPSAIPFETDLTKSCFKEARRIKDAAKKGTVCRACGSEAKLITHTLDLNKAIALIQVVKFFRHHPDADQEKYYTKEDYFGAFPDEYKELFENWEELYLYDLIARMPTHPEKVIYKAGYFGITENGIKFVQREIGVPKTAYSYNGETDSYESDFVTLDKLLEEAGLDYDELMKV